MSDIESIVVLKDAASAAIYGAQSGAGGVILVTTKKLKRVFLLLAMKVLTAFARLQICRNR